MYADVGRRGLYGLRIEDMDINELLGNLKPTPEETVGYLKERLAEMDREQLLKVSCQILDVLLEFKGRRYVKRISDSRTNNATI